MMRTSQLKALSFLMVAAVAPSLMAQTPPAKPAPKAKSAAKPGARKNEASGVLPGTAAQPPSNMDELAAKLDTPYRPKPGGHRVNVNLEDADLAQLVNHISGLTGKRFIYGAKVRQIKVTVVSPAPVTLNEAYEAFLSILHANGMTVVPHGRFLKIIDTGGIVAKGTPLYARGAPVPNTDRIITRLYRLQHNSPDAVAKVLRKFKTKEGDVSTYEPGQLLIITDTGTNIRRQIRLIEELDLGGTSSKMWIEPVHYGSASELAKQLNEIYDLKKTGKDSGLNRIIAEDQTNSLIVVGTEESYLRVLELLKRVDIAPAAEGRIQVLSLQHADADDLSKTLTRMLGGSKSSKNRAKGGSTVAEVFEGEVRITADKSTNSLVVSSSARDFAQLRLVVEKLDMKRRQVFLEAVIMDVSVDRSTRLGLGYHAGTNVSGSDGDTLVVGGFNAQESIVGPTQLQALALGVRGPDISGSNNTPGLPPGISIPAFGVVLNALAESGDSNVLSTPHIIATDNTEAEISVGENVPLQTNFAGGSSSLASLAGAAAGGNNAAAGLGALGGLGGFNFNAQRTDVGTKIKITPHINDEDQVRLEIEEEISDAGAPSGVLGAISITQRNAKTTVVVDDQQTVVIGGLMRDTLEKGREKIPILGDLPVLGFLFRNSTERVRKTNLLLILTPHVIRDQNDLRRVFQRKMQERQQFLDRYFVFNADWEPPRDFTRANGLLEDIRQNHMQLEEDELRRREAGPRELKIHQASQPLELAGSVKPGKAAKPAKAKPTKAKPKPRTAPKPIKPLPKKTNAAPIRISPIARSVNAGAPSFGVSRIE